MTKLAYAGATPLERSRINPLPPTPRRPYRKTDVDLEALERHKDKLSKPFYAILAASKDNTYKQIMEKLGINCANTVKSRMNRAKAALDKLITESQPYCTFCKKNHEGGDTCMGHHP